MRTITILLIEDNPPDARLIREMLKDISLFKSNLISVLTLKEGCEQIQKNNFDIILLDLNLPDSTGRQTFQKVIDYSNEIPVVLITGMEDEKLSLKLMVEGAQDYITKQSLNPDLLGKSILYSIERQALLRNIKIQNVQIDRIEKERILIAKFPSEDPEPVLRVAGNGKLLYINEAGIKLLPDWKLIINEIIPSRMKDIIDPIFIEGTNIEFELCHHESIYSFFAVPFIKEGYINLYGRDITEHKLAEDAVRQSRKELDSLFEASPEMICFIGFDGYFKRLNPAWVKTLGYPMDKLLSIPFIEFVHPDDREDTNAEAAKLAEGQRTIRFDNRYRCNDGSYRWLSWSIIPDTKEKLLYAVVRDITESKQAEQQIESQYILLTALINSPSDIYIFSLDKNYCYTIFSDSYRKEMKKVWNADIKIGMNILECMQVTELKELAKRSIDRALNGEAFLEIQHQPQTDTYYESSWNPVFQNEEIVGATSFIGDITERKQAEKALRESEESFRVLFEGSTQGIIATDIETHRFLFSNPAICKLFGYTNEEFKWLDITDLHPKDSLGAVMLEFESQMRGEKPISLALPCLRKDGTVFYADIAGTVTIINGRKCSVGFFLDVTTRKQAEEALSQSEENFRRSISESILGIRIVTVDEKTIYANKAFLDIYEFNSIEEFTSTPAINRHTPESYAQHKERKEKRKNGHEVFDYEISIKRKNAEIRHVKVSRKEVLWNGNKHYQVINLDITEQKKLTLDLIAAKEKAEESGRLKSAFLANMSHEIRTPMNGILGFADLLKEPKLTGKKQQEYISIIEKSGARMLNIINDIISISKVESGQMELSIFEMNVNEQIEFIYSFFKPEAEQKGIKISFKNSLPAKEVIIKTDHEKIYAILINLIKNAIKFTHAGSIEFGYEKKGKYLEFFVKDTGVGIQQEKKKIIFERFRQGSESLTRNYEGAGLGLSISKAYVEMLGGKIWVESELGKGSIFYFTIPCNAESEEKNVIKDIVSADGEENQINPEVSGLKILIAEDDETSEIFVTIAVKMFSKEVLTARTGVEAVEACRNNPDIDLVLMDIRMPEMDGYEATRQIRQFNKDVVIIAQTAYGLTGDRENAIEAGCNGYIPKPFNIASLAVLVKKYF